MLRFARLAIGSLAAVLCIGAASAQAQTTTAGDGDWYGEVNVGATFGHKSDSSVGGEAGYRFRDSLDVFLEGGYIGNAATTDFEARGLKIANAVGATVATAAQKVKFFDVGVRYHVMATPRVHPYVGFGLGVAAVKTRTDFAINGTVVPPESIGVQPGGDLEGSFTRPFVMIGFGTNIAFGTRYFADVSYRYGWVASQTRNGEQELNSIPTQRFQVGIGVRF